MNTDHKNLISQGASLKGDQLCKFITSLTSNPKLFSYGQFVPRNSLEQLNSTYPQYYCLLELFRYGNFDLYKQNPKKYPPLSPAQQKKLRQLTVLAECEKSTQMSMKGLLQKIGLGLMECVKLLIEMTDEGVLKVKISEKEDKIKVFFAISRDVTLQSKDKLLRKIELMYMY